MIWPFGRLSDNLHATYVMIWPWSTPGCVQLPGSDEPILAIDSSRAGFYVAVLTSTRLHLVRAKPFAPVAMFERQPQSLEQHGANQSLVIHPNGKIIVVKTSTENLLTFSVLSQADEVLALEPVQIGRPLTAGPGPGEGLGVRDARIRARSSIRVDSGINQLLALPDRLLISTRNPRALQMVDYDAAAAKPVTFPLAGLAWIRPDQDIVCLCHSLAMGLYVMVTGDGVAYMATLDKDHAQFRGAIVHEPSTNVKRDDRAVSASLNARYSMVAVACERGAVVLYAIKDVKGSVELIRTIPPPSSSLGPVQLVRWSPDGSSLLVSYQRAWALFSVYGMLNASTMLSNEDQRAKEPWLNGIRDCAWSLGGDSLFMVANDQHRLWTLDMLRWSADGNFTLNNLRRPSLYTQNQLLLYRGNEQPDLTTINRDALLWLHINMPQVYVADNWPIRYVSISSDGKYIAIAGVRGLAHYSLYSGRWKLFVNEYSERHMTVSGCMIWYRHILLAGTYTEDGHHRIQAYSRDTDLDPRHVLVDHDMGAQILKMALVHNVLLVYTVDNVLHYLRIVAHLGKLELRSEREVSLASQIELPLRVRSLTALATDPGQSLELDSIAVLLLIDGMLVILQHDKGADAFSKHILHHHIEHFTVTPTPSKDQTLWAFDGHSIVVWINVFGQEDHEKTPVILPVESYPLAVLPDKAIIMGLEIDAVLAREAKFTAFRHGATTQLFVPGLLESYLRSGHQDQALSMARQYTQLSYFGHILEMLLFNSLTDNSSAELLARVAGLVKEFSQMASVILGCTRKVELTYWRPLFDVVGPPQQLFEQCVQDKQYELAAGYLLVLQNLDQQNFESTTTLFKLAYEAKDWQLCKDLARYLTNVDRTTATLSNVLQELDIVV